MDDAIDRAKRGDLEFFKEASPDILLNARDSNDDDTVLSIVVYDNRLDCCKEICKKCPSLLRNQTRREGSTPLHIAAYSGYLGILKLLISTCEKADQAGDRADKQNTFKLTTRYGSNAMHKAVYGRQTESVKLLIDSDPNNELLKAGDRKNNTPLHLAVGLKAEKKTKTLARLLIKADPGFAYGANLDKKTPLLMAIDKAERENDREMLKLILELQPTQSMVKWNENGWTALHYSVYKRKLDTTGYIIQSCPESSKVVDNDGRNFFHHAVKSGNVNMVKHILGMKGIDTTVLNRQDYEGRTPLDTAVPTGQESITLCLLEDPRVDKKLAKAKHLQWVVEKHNFVLMNLLIEGNPDFLKKIDFEVLLNSRDENGDTILFKAAQKNHLFLCKELYKRCPSLLYHKSKGGRTSLHHAAWRGEPEMLKFLIAAGAKSYNDEYAEEDIEIPQKMLFTMVDDQGDTALHKAVLNHKLEAVKLLVEADPDYEYGANKSGDTPIIISVREARSNENMFDSTGEIRKLLFGQTMAHRGENGWTLLHQATFNGDLSSIEDIIKFCPEYLDVEDNEGKNFLHIAAELEKIEVVRLVLRAKDIPSNVLYNQDKARNTPLDIAEKTENKPLISCFLFDLGFIKTMPLRGENGWTLLHQATFEGDLSIINKFIKFWPSYLDGVDNDGKNFLHIAAEFEKVEIVKQVLRAKYIPLDVLNKKDNDKNTPFHIAAITGNEPLTRCFLFDRRVDKDTVNEDKQHVLSSIKFPYDKRKAGVYGIADTVDQSDLKDQSDFDLVVGALIATVSFTAGITVPGGYISDGPNQGTAVFSKKGLFATFIISNSLALIFSFYAVFSHFCARRLTENAHIIKLLNAAKGCTLAAMYCMMVAFIAGSFAVLAKSNWLAIVVCIISCAFFILSCGPLWMVGTQSKRAAPASQHKRWKCFGFS